MLNNLVPKNLYIFDDFETKNRNVWDFSRLEEGSFEITEEQKYSGVSSLKITVQKGDKQETGNDGKLTERAELKEHRHLWLGYGISIWYSWYFYLPEHFLICDNRLVIAQWKQFTKVPSRSPFLSVRYRNGIFFFQVIYEEQRTKFKKKIDLRGAWHKIVLNYQLNEDLTGHVKGVLDGQVLCDYKGKLGFRYTKKQIYFKMGLYRDMLDEPQTIYLDRYRRSLNKISVDM